MPSTNPRPSPTWREAGLTILELIIVIIVVMTLVIAAMPFLINWLGTVPPRDNTPNRQDPASVLIISGPTKLRPGASGTYTLRVTYPEPIHPNLGFVVVAEIYEDDFGGDVRLDRFVKVRIPAGSKTGTGTFTLTCLDPPPPDGNYIIKGDNGTNTLDDVWEVYGYVPHQVPSGAEEGPNYDVTCEEP